MTKDRITKNSYGFPKYSECGHEYEVYVARTSGVVMYVGYGKIGRHSHINSGISHVYQANKAHFSHIRCDISIECYGPKDFCSEEERRLITELRPMWNSISYLGDCNSLKSERHKWVKKFFDTNGYIGISTLLLHLYSDPQGSLNIVINKQEAQTIIDVPDIRRHVRTDRKLTFASTKLIPAGGKLYTTTIKTAGLLTERGFCRYMQNDNSYKITTWNKAYG